MTQKIVHEEPLPNTVHKGTEGAAIMPPKNPKPAKGKQKQQEDQRDESLQAIVSMCLA